MKPQDSQFGDEFDASPVERREELERFARLLCGRQLLTLTPQESVRGCLKTGEPANCTAQYRSGTGRHTFPIRLELREGKLRISAPEWPSTLRPVSVVFTSRDFPPIASCQREFLIGTQQKSPPSTHNVSRGLAGRYSLELAAASGDEADDADNPEVEIDWDGKVLRVSLEDDAHRTGTVYAVAEMVVENATVLVRPVIISEHPPGTWCGKCRFRLPDATRAASVTIRVRSASPDDIDLFEPAEDFDSFASSVTAFLAEAQVATSLVYPSGVDFETSTLPPLDADQSVISLAAVQKEALGDCPPPFDSHPSDLMDAVRERMSEFRRLSLEGDSARASLHFWEAWLMAEPRLSSYLVRRMRDLGAARDVLMDTLFAVQRAYPRAPNDQNPLGFFYLTATRLFWKRSKHAKRESALLWEPCVDASREPVSGHQSAAAMLRDIQDRHLSQLTDRESHYWALVTQSPDDLTQGELAALLDISLDGLRKLEQRVFRKLKVMYALETLKPHLSNVEHEFLRLRELRLTERKGLGKRQRIQMVVEELRIDEGECLHLESTAVPKLAIAIGVNWLVRTDGCSAHEGDFVQGWCLGENPELWVNHRHLVSDERRRRLAQMLRAAILLEAEDFCGASLDACSRGFLQVVCVEGKSYQELIAKLNTSELRSDGTQRVSRFETAFGNDVASLARHVQNIWTSARTLVPQAESTWAWDCTEPPPSRNRA